MGITEVLTIIFVVLKLLGKINWSWWLVLLPEILAAVWYATQLICVVLFRNRVARSFRDDDWR